MSRVVTAILGGGQGSRLWPLTRHRAKPAVPVAGKFRLIDIPISNSLHAGYEEIFVITQFNSASLHRHIAQTYRFDSFRSGYVNILAAEQGLENRDWYQGTADAVRQNLARLTFRDPSEVLVLSGDQLYLLDLERFVDLHREREADLTIAVNPVSREEASAFGLMRVDRSGRIVDFVEKPTDPAVLDRFTLDAATIESLGLDTQPGKLLASMGMYVFADGVLQSLLVDEQPGTTDFGKEVIPAAIESREVYAFLYNGYWRDIGTIPAFLEANLELAAPRPPLNLYDSDRPIYTHARFLPGLKMQGCQVERSVLCEGTVIGEGCTVRQSVIGIRSMIGSGTTVEESIVLGTSPDQRSAGDPNPVRIGIGRDCQVRRSIVDRGARLGDGVRLLNAAGLDEADGEGWSIRGGIIVVHAEAVIPPGTIV